MRGSTARSDDVRSSNGSGNEVSQEKVESKRSKSSHGGKNDKGGGVSFFQYSCPNSLQCTVFWYTVRCSRGDALSIYVALP